MNAQQRLEVDRILADELDKGTSPDVAMKVVLTMFPNLTVGDLRQIVQERMGRSRANMMVLQDQIVAEDQLAAFLRKCPAFASGMANMGEAVDWLAEHGSTDERETARRWQTSLEAGRFHEEQVDRAVAWSPWAEALPDGFRFLEGYPYGPDDDAAVSRLLVDFLAHDLKENPPADHRYGRDPRYELMWDAWYKTIPPHVVLRIKNAPNERNREHWTRHAAEVEPGIPEPVRELLRRKRVASAVNEVVEKALRNGTVGPRRT